jgi:prepilin-type N-terminal cleavage/methylation domain-containing protein
MQSFNERMKARGQGGFTLIELLVVIAILGILAGVIVFAVGGVTGTAQDKACEIEGKSVETAIQAYQADNDALPATLAALTPTYMKDDPSTNWTMTGTEVVGTTGGDCDGVDPN